MKVLIDFKVTVLEGDNEGATYHRSFVDETDTKFTDIGVVEEVRVGWKYLHDMPKPAEVKEEKSCSDCIHSGRPAFMYPCYICNNYDMFKKGEKDE